MLIDEDRIHVLTKYATTKGVQRKSESDHNIMFAKFKIEVQKMKKNDRVEFFDFKNPESQMAYFEQTNCVQQFRNVFSSEVDVEENTEIRITGKVNTKDEILFVVWK